MLKTAFLITTHYVTPRIESFIARAERELSADVFITAFFHSRENLPIELKHRENFVPYFAEDLVNKDYPKKGRAEPFHLVPGNVDLLVLRFAQDNPVYDAIWFWEGDADYTGSLKEFCGHFDALDSDLVGTHVDWRRKNWARTKIHDVPEGWPEDLNWPFSGLLPVFRVSRKFLDKLDEFYRDGGDGHHEWSWFYVARVSGLVFEDFGGNGPFVRPEHKNKFYKAPRFMCISPGTFRYRPMFSKLGSEPNKIYHPIKDKPICIFETMKWYFRTILRDVVLWIVGEYRVDRKQLKKYALYSSSKVNKSK